MDAATRSGNGAGGAGVIAIVEYDYNAKEPDELDLFKGAIIHSIKQMPGGWWEGTLQANGKNGMFPDNFVRIIDSNEDNSVTLREKSATNNRRCKVIYSYTQVNDDELSLAVGDVIEFLGEVEEGWWRGRLKTKVGVFPSNFVVAIEPSPVLASKRPPTLAGPPAGAAFGASPQSALSSALSFSSAAAVKSMMAAYTGPGSAAAAAAAAAAASSASSTTTSSSSTMTMATTALSSATSTSTKKTNRLSFHSSKEDLLGGKSSAAAASSSSSSAGLDEAAPSLPPKPQRDFCRVEFPYAPQNEDELELKVGDIITVINMDLPDKGWWKGELRGKVGVFPDNFVKLMAPSEEFSMEKASIEIFGARMANFINTIFSPLNDLQHTPRTSTTATTAKATNASAAGAAPVAAAATSHLTGSSTQQPQPQQLATSTTHGSASASASSSSAASKVFVKKSGSSSSSSQSSNRKDSFGSRDSLNDILSETGLPSGNVAAQRKSLENKNLDLKKQHQQTEAKTISVTSSSSSASANTSMSSTSELRKSAENLDEKTKTTPPPPVLTKKPSVPTKKSTTVTSVAGNLLSGLKQKVKNVENKLTTTVSHDYADGVGSSKMSPGGGLPEAGPGGNIVMRRAATIAVEDSEFDRVERSSILPDMRAGRVRAPKRRPPSTAVGNLIGGESNNNSVYLNGGGSAEHLLSSDEAKPHSSDENSTGEGEQLAKPKPREWEKQKAPWMEELKASQVKKKVSPNVEPRRMLAGGSTASGGITERASKLHSEEAKITSSITSSSSSHSSNNNNAITSNNTSANVISSSSSSSATSTTTKVQSSSVTSSSVLQQSMTAETKSNAPHPEIMAKSMNSKLAVADADDVRTRPNTLSIRNRSMSPAKAGTQAHGHGHAHSNANSNASSGSARAALKASASPADAAHATAVSSATTAQSSSAVGAKSSSTTLVNSNHHENNGKVTNNHAPHHHHAATATDEGSAGGSRRVLELERRVEKLEVVVQTQQRTIDELVRTLREETDRVKVLRGELDKYAQCVTQV